MPTVAELIASRLVATGTNPKIASRFAALIEQDLLIGGYCVVQKRQLSFLTAELFSLQGALKLLADACSKLPPPPATKETP